MTVTSAEAIAVEILTAAVEKASNRPRSRSGPGQCRLVDYFARRARRSESQIHTVLTSRRIQPR